MKRRRLHALALAGLLAAPALSFAEEPPAAAPAAAPAPAPAPEPASIAPVPLPQVVEQGEEVERTARKLGELSAPVPEIEEIEARLPEQSALLAERAKKAKKLASDPASLVALDDELKLWELAREQLASSLELLTGRLTDLEVALEDLSRQRQIWKATEEAALQAVAPDTLVGRIRDVSQALRDAKRSVEKRRDELLSLQTQVAEQEKRARAALDELTEARSSFRSLLFLRDSPPFWAAARGEPGEARRDLLETLAPRWRAFVHFVQARRDRLVLHLLLLGVALAITLAQRGRASAWRADDPRLEASAVIFERPFSAALLLVVSLTPVLNPRAPRLADAIAAALLVIPLLRLLPRLLEPALAPAVYALALFGLLDRIRDVGARSVFFERSLLLVETLAAFVFLFWMLRPARLAALPAGTRVPRTLGYALRTALAFLGLSALANVAGWVHLSRVLADGVLGSAYLAVVLYGGVRVVRTAFRAGLRSESARRLGVVRRHFDEINVWLRRGINGFAFAIWGYFTLAAFGVEAWAWERLAGLLGAEARFGSLGISLGDVLAFAVTLAVAFWVSRALRAVLEDDVVPRLPAGRGVGYALTTTVHYAVLLLGFLLAISAAGVDLNKVSLLAGAFGVGIGFGLQNVVNNFISGLILLYERPVQIGDLIEVGATTGEVRRIGIRSSTIRTGQGADVIVPNSSLIQDRVVNWTFTDRRRRFDVRIAVAYGSDPERVIAVMDAAARANPELLREPPPEAVFVAFGDNALEFELQAWTLISDSNAQTRSAVALAMRRALTEAGIALRGEKI